MRTTRLAVLGAPVCGAASRCRYPARLARRAGFRRRAGLLALPAVASVALAGCVVQVGANVYTSREERAFRVSGPPVVSVATFDGAVEVRAWDRSEVRVEIEKSGENKELVDRIQVAASQEGDRIEVEVRQPDVSGWVATLAGGHSLRAKLVVSLPRRSDLHARTGDGSVSAEQLTGRIELTTGDGSVRGIDLEGDVRVVTGDGSVRLDAVTGRVDVRTGDGSIVVGGRLVSVRARTGDGSVSISAEPGSVAEDDWEISSGDGRIALYVPEGFAAEIDARTRDGIVRADEALELATTEKGRTSLRGVLGAGGRVIRLRTGDGSISLRKS